MSTAKDRLMALTSAFAEKNNTNNNNSGSAPWKKFYQFWKMPDDATATVRFLPDRDEGDNPLKFLVENFTHKLVVNGKEKTVPCLSMYGESCPICELSQKYYNEKNDEMGKKYYKKRSYIGQVLVIDSPFDYIDEKEENPGIVKLIEFGPKVFKCIQAAFKSGDLEEAPYEFRGGYNFRIKKTKAGQYADYGTSSFAPKQSDLDDEVIEAVRDELYSLSDFREKHVSRASLEAMLLADQTGKAMDDAGSTPAPKAESNEGANESQSSSTGDSDAPAAQDDGAKAKASSVLEQLRARAAAKKASSED